jgi:hypothetical protein
MARALLTATLLLFVAPSANAILVYPFTDTKTFAGHATEVIIADCLEPDPSPGPKVDGVTAVEADVVKVLKGNCKTGKAKLATIGQPMEKGHRYPMVSFGGSALGTDFLAQADLAVVEVPAGFDLKTLDGKTVPEQIQLVFDARREQVRFRLIQLQQEKAALDRTVPKPKQPSKLDPPTFKLKSAVQRGETTTCRLRSQTRTPNRRRTSGTPPTRSSRKSSRALFPRSPRSSNFRARSGRRRTRGGAGPASDPPRSRRRGR